MSFLQRILVPTDFSENAGAAVERAIGVAAAFGARIDLVHALAFPGRAALSYDVKLPPDVVRMIADAAAERLEGVLHRVRSAGVEAEMHMSDEAPHEAINHIASRLDADLIAMGTRGVGGLKHVLLGSCAERTLRTAPCPVLTATPAASGAPPRPRRVLVPTDLSEGDEVAADLAISFADPEAEREVVLVHAYFVPTLVRAFMDEGGEPRFGEVSERLQTKLEEVAEGLRGRGVRVTAVLEEGSAEQVILTAARQRAAELIVMRTRGATGLSHAILGSVTERVVRAASCPTLTLGSAHPSSS